MMTRRVELLYGDLDREWSNIALREGTIAWDIETSGLDWSKDRIGTCQVSAGSSIALVRLEPGRTPQVLRALLADQDVVKVFHHAPFDLRFMGYAWGVVPANIACTKVAAKIVDPGLEPREYSLKPLLKRHLGVDIDKSQQVSDWIGASLSDAQIAYAANDVRYLVPLLGALLEVARERGVLDHVTSSYAYLPTRVALDLRGAGDVFSY